MSFLLKESRARAFTLRTPIVDVRAALARHLVGGSTVNSGRLDYLVAWTQNAPGGRTRHRDISDRIEQEVHTPGARLTNRQSNAIHAAFTGTRKGDPRPANPAEYAELILNELRYKTDTMDAALRGLAALPESRLREVYRAVEGDAQAVWRRRLAMHASDLVRFGRTYRHWRNSLVPTVEAGDKCNRQLLALTNPQTALDAAGDAGTRQLATARVVSVDPIALKIDSRRIGDGDRIVLLHVNEIACIEQPDVDVKFQKGSFKFSGMSIGPLAAIDAKKRLFEWFPAIEPEVNVGDEDSWSPTSRGSPTSRATSSSRWSSRPRTRSLPPRQPAPR